MSGKKRVALDRPESILVPLGALLALLLPYVVFSLQSDDAFRDAKLAGQALGGLLVLAGLAKGGGVPWVPRPPASPFSRLAWGAGSALLLLVVASALSGASRVDPLTAVALLAPFPLLVVGLGPGRPDGDHGPLSDRLLDVLCFAGAVTGALAFSQRYLGVLRMPLQVPEPRYLAAAFVGNPGDVGAALVLPGIVLWARLSDPPEVGSARGRAISAAGLLCVLLGFGATEAVTPFLAFAAGLLVHTLFGLRERWKGLALLLVAGAIAVGTTGMGRKLAEVAQMLGKGDVASATTQRDIGLRAAVEAIRARPLLGAGPGAFGLVFVPSRLAAEERIRRPLVHRSESAHFENAHDDWMTLAAECGVPALLALLVLLGAVFAALFRARRLPGPACGAADVSLLVSLLSAAAVLMTGNFPLRLAVTSGPLALCLGFAWRRAFPGTAGKPSGAQAWAGRGFAFALGLALVTGASARLGSAWMQGEAEGIVRGLGVSGGIDRASVASAADAAAELLSSSLRLRPRNPAALLDLGSVQLLLGKGDEAQRLYLRSLALAERAETLLNLGRTAHSRGDRAAARAYCVRGVWILPRLAAAIPPGAVPEGIETALANAREVLAKEGKVPPLPVQAN